jgi:holo-[acyl-carrier protein] synthase
MNKGVNWQGMGVVNLPGGRPTMELSGGALKRLESLMPAGHKPVIHLTITDEEPYAQAYVIIEAVPVS